MRSLSIALTVLLGSSVCLAGQDGRPVLYVAKDGLPTGHASPEGAVCDLERAYIRHDAALYQNACIKPFGGGENRENYEHALAEAAAKLNAPVQTGSSSTRDFKVTNSKGGIKAISKVFAARNLTKGGPASYGYATFGFKDVAFVDVSVQFYSGRTLLNRTLVIQDSSGKWYVHPFPALVPLLSEGLNNESPSTRGIADVYTLKKG